MKISKNQIYTLFIIIAGIFVLAMTLQTVDEFPTTWAIIFFIGLATLTESLSIQISETAYISIGFAIGLTALLTFHPAIASLIMACGALLNIQTRHGKSYHIFNLSFFHFYQRLFNSAAYVISYTLAGYAFVMCQQRWPAFTVSSFSIIGILMSILVYIIVNTFIYLILFSIIQKESFLKLLKGNLWVITNLFAIAPLGIIIAITYRNFGWFGFLLFFLPLLLARYSFTLYLNMHKVYFDTIQALSNTIDAKDPYTKGHSQRVAHYSQTIARQLGFAPSRLTNLRTAAILHDVGKIGISDSILNKPGSLTDLEYQIIQGHPQIGTSILKEVDSLKDIAKFIHYHHEHYDGSGYPLGLAGDDIPLESSIIAVADALDAMTTDRPYRKAMDLSAAVAIIREESGKQFSPVVVEAFLNLVEDKPNFLEIN